MYIANSRRLPALAKASNYKDIGILFSLSFSLLSKGVYMKTM